MYTLTHTTGKTIELPWRTDGKVYARTLCSFLYNLTRAERANWKLSKDGREINLAKAIAFAAKEMNAVRHGQRVPAEPEL